MPNGKQSSFLPQLASKASTIMNNQSVNALQNAKNTYANIEITDNAFSNGMIILDYENHYFNDQTKRLHPNYMAFSYADLGTSTYIYNETEYVLEEKNGLLWDSNVKLVPNIQQIPLTLIFPKKMFHQLTSNLQAFLNQPLPLYTDNAFIVVNYLKFMFENQSNIKKNTEILLFNTFIELLAIYTHSLNTSQLSGHRRDLMDNIKKYIEENIKNPNLNPSKIAEKFSISTRYIHKLFKTEGITLANFILDMRLEKCRRELILFYPAKKKVIDIAFKWGFNDAAHFSKVFKKKYGVSPSQYQTQQGDLLQK